MANKPCHRERFIFSVLGLLVANVAFAEPAWIIRPELTISETYTDNVGLDVSGQEQDDLITQINPGVEFSKKGGGLRVVGRYQMQTLTFVDDGDRNDVNHSLAMKADADLVEDWLYMDANASLSQALISAQDKIALDNFSGTDNRGDVATLRLSPYLRHDFGGYMTAETRYTLDRVDIQSGASDSLSQQYQVRLESGRRSPFLTWGLNYDSEIIRRDTSSDPRFENAEMNAAYRVTRALRLMARAGYEENDFDTQEPIENGSYWGAGVGWQPSRFYSVELLKGGDYENANLALTPNQRTSLELSYLKRGVGRNPGSQWSGAFSYRARKLFANARYREETITVQQLQSYQGQTSGLTLVGGAPGSLSSGVDDVFVFVNAAGETVFFSPGIGLFSLTDELIHRNRGDFSVGYKTAKSLWQMNIYKEERDSLATRGTENGKGGYASWTWDFAKRTSSMIRYGVQKTDFSIGNRHDELDYWQLKFNRKLSPDSNASLIFWRAEQDSSSVADNYVENRITAQFVTRF